MPARFTLIPALLGPLTHRHLHCRHYHHHHTHVYASQNIESGPFQFVLPIPLKGLGAQEPLGGSGWHCLALGLWDGAPAIGAGGGAWSMEGFHGSPQSAPEAAAPPLRAPAAVSLPRSLSANVERARDMEGGALKSWEGTRHLIPLSRTCQRSASGRALCLSVVTRVCVARAWRTQALPGQQASHCGFRGGGGPARPQQRHPCKGTVLLSVGLVSQWGQDLTPQPACHLRDPQGRGEDGIAGPALSSSDEKLPLPRSLSTSAWEAQRTPAPRPLASLPLNPRAPRSRAT